MSTLDSTQVSNTLRRLFGDMANDKQRIGELREKYIKEGLISPDEDLKLAALLLRKAAGVFTHLADTGWHARTARDVVDRVPIVLTSSSSQLTQRFHGGSVLRTEKLQSSATTTLPRRFPCTLSLSLTHARQTQWRRVLMAFLQRLPRSGTTADH